MRVLGFKTKQSIFNFISENAIYFCAANKEITGEESCPLEARAGIEPTLKDLQSSA